MSAIFCFCSNKRWNYYELAAAAIDAFMRTFFQYLEPCTTLHTRRYNAMSWFKNILFPKIVFWSLSSALLPTSSVNICRCKWKRWRRTIPPSWWSPHSASATSWSTRSDHYVCVSVTKLTRPSIKSFDAQMSKIFVPPVWLHPGLSLRSDLPDPLHLRPRLFEAPQR